MTVLKKQSILPMNPAASSSKMTVVVDQQRRRTPQSNTIAANLNSNRPLSRKYFVLDVENHHNRDLLQKEIHQLGGTIIDGIDYDRRCCYVVSDYCQAEQLERRSFPPFVDTKHKAEINRKTQQPTAPLLDVNRLPMLLRQAASKDIPVMTAKSALTRLRTMRRKQKTDQNMQKAPMKSQQNTAKVANSRSLTGSYIKFQDVRGEFQPNYKEFTAPTNWFPIYLNGRMFEYIILFYSYIVFDAGRSVFHEKKDNHRVSTGALSKRPALRRREKTSRTTRNVFCEICGTSTDDIDTHLDSREHQSLISVPGFYDQVDVLLGSYNALISVPTVASLLEPKSDPPSSSSRAMMTEESHHGTDNDDNSFSLFATTTTLSSL